MKKIKLFILCKTTSPHNLVSTENNCYCKAFKFSESNFPETSKSIVNKSLDLINVNLNGVIKN